MKKGKPIDEFIRIMEEVVRMIQDERTFGPVFIDVQISSSPDMCPVLQTFHNKNNAKVDILETDKNIYALIELPGLEKKDISYSCNGRQLEITTVYGENIENIELPARVNKTGARIKYENGILEVVFKKSKRVSKK